MNEERRKSPLDTISDSLLHACEQYLRGMELNLPPDRMDKIADSVQQLFKARWRANDHLPLPPASVIPTQQLTHYDDIMSSQFLDWVATIHKTLKAREGGRYGG